MLNRKPFRIPATDSDLLPSPFLSHGCSSSPTFCDLAMLLTGLEDLSQAPWRKSCRLEKDFVPLFPIPISPAQGAGAPTVALGHRKSCWTQTWAASKGHYLSQVKKKPLPHTLNGPNPPISTCSVPLVSSTNRAERQLGFRP